MSLAPINPTQLKKEVSEHPDWPDVLSTAQLEELYEKRLCPEAPVLQGGDYTELQNLIDLTRIHLLREAEASLRTEQRGSTAGRPRRTLSAVKWKLSIREDLAVFLDLHLLDPVRGQVQLGARSVLVEELLLKWARERGFKN